MEILDIAHRCLRTSSGRRCLSIRNHSGQHQWEDAAKNPSIPTGAAEKDNPLKADRNYKLQGRTRRTVLENVPVIALDRRAPEAYVSGDAAFVLKAMRSHDALCDALKDARNAIDGDVDYFDLRDRINAALALVDNPNA